ncbi:hypothetical protein PQR68_32730 [Paraburkholderia agricolaris]|uniref:hypothetical protein n=1 Tax=Paraburkholderia agricolaris TaxID=2152888 RepID=UPI0038B718C2
MSPDIGQKQRAVNLNQGVRARGTSNTERSERTRGPQAVATPVPLLVQRSVPPRRTTSEQRISVVRSGEVSFEPGEIAEYIRSLRQIGRKRGTNHDDGAARSDADADNGLDEALEDLEGFGIEAYLGDASEAQSILDSTLRRFKSPMEKYLALRHALDTEEQRGSAESGRPELLREALRLHETEHADEIRANLAAFECARDTSLPTAASSTFGHLYCQMVSGVDGMLANLRKMKEACPGKSLPQVLDLANSALSRDQLAVRTAPGRLAQFQLNRHGSICQCLNTVVVQCTRIMKLVKLGEAQRGC